MSREPLISIVDDDESVRDAVQTLLESTGRHTVAFASAEQFLASSVVRATRCLILDLRMPGINGEELQRRLLAAGYRLPTIVLTAHGDDAARARALTAGAVAFLRKPFQPDTLLEAVEASLRLAADVPDDSRGSR
ncbi:MAG TPA: response regulator [Candidatus Methylomirabilis sp.]|nr:response regulator [Candidatus Methylomirabilis sp.]